MVEFAIRSFPIAYAMLIWQRLVAELAFVALRGTMNDPFSIECSKFTIIVAMCTHLYIYISLISIYKLTINLLLI